MPGHCLEVRPFLYPAERAARVRSDQKPPAKSTMSQPPIGIDLGTTNSLIATLVDGKPELLQNAVGETLTPSVVAVHDGTVLVGQAAKERLVTDPRNATAAFKRRMGTKNSVKLGAKSFLPEDLSALVLRKLKDDAEAQLGCTIEDVVVSVPAYFNQSQRQATSVACRLAGLNPVGLVNEPTAAALAYGLQNREDESQFLVFDLGGGTFDVTILEHFDDVMEVKASSGDAFLGGEDFTDALAQQIALEMHREWASLGKDLQRQIRIHADNLKHHLSSNESYDISLLDGDEQIDISVTRSDFESASKQLMRRMLRPIERCFYDTELSPEKLDRVIMVGGATRMPMVRQMIARHLKKFPEANINPDHAVALGAAVQAGLLAEDKALVDVVMTDVSPFSVGVEVATPTGKNNFLFGFFDPIIERNTPLPASREKYFHTLQDNQTKLEVVIYQGEAPKVSDNVELGRFELRVPRAKAGEEGMAVRITYDTSGLIDVSARSLNSDDSASLVIKDNAQSLSEKELAARLKAMESLKVHPREDEENIALLARLDRLYSMARGEDRDYIRSLIVDFELVLGRQEPTEIADAHREISEVLNKIDDFYVS